jgi:hypothetical protein
MALENLEKEIDFLALLIIFLIISLFGYNLYSQPTKKNKRLLPRPVTGESTAGEELREQRTLRHVAKGRSSEVCGTHLTPIESTLAQQHVWSNQGQSKVGSVRRL